MVFNPDSSAYKTCCCHVRTCTLVIGILELIAITAQFLNTVISGANSGLTGATSGASIALAVIMFIFGLVVIILLFVGLKKQNHKFLIPHLVFQVFAMIIVGIFIVIFILGVVVAESNSTDEVVAKAVLIAGIIGIVVCALAIAFEIWFFVVVLRCYRFFRDQGQAGYPANIQLATVGMQQQNYPQVQQQQQYPYYPSK